MPNLQYAAVGGFLFWLTIIGTVFSVISSIKKKKEQSYSNAKMPNPQFQNYYNRNNGQHPYQANGFPQQSSNGQYRQGMYSPNTGNFTATNPNYQREQWNQQRIWQETRLYTEEGHMQESSYAEEERFRQSTDQFEIPMPTEYVHEEFTEYVGEEFGEPNHQAVAQKQYYEYDMQRALEDEQDIARAKAYSKGKEYAMPGDFSKRVSTVKQIFSEPKSIKKAIIMSEILNKPKAMQE